jgi:hypothetical protein
MYWWGLFITVADVLIALGVTSSLTESRGKLTRKRRHTNKD